MTSEPPDRVQGRQRKKTNMAAPEPSRVYVQVRSSYSPAGLVSGLVDFLLYARSQTPAPITQLRSEVLETELQNMEVGNSKRKRLPARVKRRLKFLRQLDSLHQCLERHVLDNRSPVYCCILLGTSPKRPQEVFHLHLCSNPQLEGPLKLFVLLRAAPDDEIPEFRPKRNFTPKFDKAAMQVHLVVTNTLLEQSPDVSMSTNGGADLMTEETNGIWYQCNSFIRALKQ